MEVINFLSRNFAKVLALFNDGYNNLEDYWKNLHSGLSFFLRITLPLVLNPLIGVSSSVVFIVNNVFSQLVRLCFDLYGSLNEYVLDLQNNVKIINKFLFNPVVDVAAGMYSSLNTVARPMFPQLVTMGFELFGNIVTTSKTIFPKTFSLATDLFPNIFSLTRIIFNPIADFINSGGVGFVGLLLKNAPSLISIITTPVNLINDAINIVPALFNTIKSIGEDKLWYLMTGGIKVITDIIPMIDNMRTILNPSNYLPLMSMLTSYLNGLPDIKHAINQEIEIKLVDTILDILERAIERYW